MFYVWKPSRAFKLQNSLITHTYRLPNKRTTYDITSQTIDLFPAGFRIQLHHYPVIIVEPVRTKRNRWLSHIRTSSKEYTAQILLVSKGTNTTGRVERTFAPRHSLLGVSGSSPQYRSGTPGAGGPHIPSTRTPLPLLMPTCHPTIPYSPVTTLACGELIAWLLNVRKTLLSTKKWGIQKIYK